MLANIEYLAGLVLLPTVVLFFLFWSIVGAGIGVGLIFSSQKMFRVFALLNRYVSTRHNLKAFAVPYDIGGGVGRHRRWIGPLFVLGAGYSIYGLSAPFDNVTIVAALNLAQHEAAAGLLLDTLRWTLIVFGVMAIAVGIMLSYFHGTLGKLEKRLNRWYSVRKITLGLDTMHMAPDSLVAAYPRASGLIIAAGSVYVGANALMQWLLLH